MKHFWAIWIVILAFSSSMANVAISVPFGSHMVLQRGQLVPIWGTAAAGEAVTVTLNGQVKSATADANGKWSVKLDAMVAGGPFTMSIVGKNTVSFSDVMVGEVWHCAGQSNMDTRMNYSEYPNLADSIKTANYPLLRYITMRQPNQTIQWQQVTPSTVGSMTATGYFFGRELLANLQGVAVGILNTSVGGTTIEQWIDPATVATVPDLQNNATASTMYTEWVKPVVGYAVKGTVWLQGENNTGSALASSYGKRLQELIPGWRKVWGQAQMPFIVAGLCHKGGVQTAAGEASNQAIIREAQRLVSDTIPQVWHSVLIDLGSETTWHYPQKPEAGRRLGKVARAAVYSQSAGPYLSPKPIACFKRGSQIVLSIDTKASTLQWKENTAPYGFEVAGADQKWSWAKSVTLKGDSLFLTTDIANPTQVRHAWANNPILKLWTAGGLPVSPFRMNIGQEPAPPVVILNSIQDDRNCGGEGVQEASNAGFEGLGYWNMNNAIGSSVGFAMQVKTTPQKPTWFRFANGGTTARTVRISVNGAASGVDVSFAPSGAWTTWLMASATIPWAVGRDSLVFTSTSADGGPNLDWIGFEDGSVASADCQQPVNLRHSITMNRAALISDKIRFYNLRGERLSKEQP